MPESETDTEDLGSNRRKIEERNAKKGMALSKLPHHTLGEHHHSSITAYILKGTSQNGSEK